MNEERIKTETAGVRVISSVSDALHLSPGHLAILEAAKYAGYIYGYMSTAKSRSVVAQSASRPN